MDTPTLTDMLDAVRAGGDVRAEPARASDAGAGVGLDTGQPAPDDPIQANRLKFLALLVELLPADRARRLSRREMAGIVTDVVIEHLDDDGIAHLDLLQQRQLVSVLISDLATGRATTVLREARERTATDLLAKSATPAASAADAPPDEAGDGDAGDAPRSEVAVPAPGEAPAVADRLAAPEAPPVPTQKQAIPTSLEEAKRQVKPLVLERIDVGLASSMEPETLKAELREVVGDVCRELRIQINQSEFSRLVMALVDDMIGLGPLEPLLADESVNDIMVNGPHQVYVERRGKLELSDVQFQDDQHVMNIATRIVTRIGRRIDESSPICDARLADGSRVNVIVPPLAIDGPSISIRKFSRRRITLDMMGSNGNLSPAMSQFLKIASRCRLNILISGGTGSGKTTLLNALSQLIDYGERVVTVEDAAELQLQQPHVVRLETRPPSLEGKGEVTIRDLVKNTLRMRPDRIIVGEVRGAEALDMLQAMNTGHDGSMCTLHANRPRDALIRLENMVTMASANLPPKALRTQIASAIHVIIQISRMRDGMRRITSISEVCGMEGDVIITQDLFVYEFEGEDDHGRLKGRYRSAGVRPHFTPRAEYYGLGPALQALM